MIGVEHELRDIRLRPGWLGLCIRSDSQPRSSQHTVAAKLFPRSLGTDIETAILELLKETQLKRGLDPKTSSSSPAKPSSQSHPSNSCLDSDDDKPRPVRFSLTT